MYSWSPNLSQITLKNSFWKVVFQILAEIEMTRNENRLFGRHFETVQIFYIFFLKYGCDKCIYLCKRWKSGFLWGFHGTPLCSNGSAGYLMQLSVNWIPNYWALDFNCVFSKLGISRIDMKVKGLPNVIAMDVGLNILHTRVAWQFLWSEV